MNAISTSRTLADAVDESHDGTRINRIVDTQTGQQTTIDNVNGALVTWTWDTATRWAPTITMRCPTPRFF
jgi:hypothetical protein